MRLPVVLPLDPQQALRVDAELEAGRALEEMMANRLDSALERVNRILASEPAHAQARVVRALVYLFRGNNTLALQDINAGMAGEPALRVLRGRIRLHAGDEPGALQDARAAIQSYPDRPDVLMQYAWVLINAGQWNEAETALARLAKLAPMDAEADVLRKQMRVLRRMPVAQAQAYQRAQLSLPLTLALDFAAVKQQMTAGDIEGALTRMRSILAYVETQRNAGVDPLYVEERCWLLIATLRLSRYAPDDVPVGISFLEKLAKRHPDWPSVLCLRITLDRSLTLARAVALYKQAVALPGTKDIFLLETRVLQDMDLRGQVGLLLIQSAGERMDSKPNEKDVMLMRELAESVTSFMPEGPARHLLALVKEAIRVTELEIAGNTAPEEIDGLQRAMADQLVRIQPPGAKSDGLNLLVMQTMFLPLFHSHVENAAETKDLALTDRFFTSVARALNSDWNDTATLEKAAEHLMAVHLLYGKIIALRVVETPAYRQLLEQRRKEEVGIAEAVEMLNIARDQAIVQAPDLPEYMRRYLRIAFTLNYSALLPDDDTAAVATALAPRETREINALCESAASLVELKAARLIIEQAGLLLSSWNPESHVIKQLLVDTHRRGRKLDAQFLAKIARP
ncbi:MAG: hypothetical protein BWY76_02722 [bacterium ADurb.Bin429]|nr:MAG: hypothetical protein BWY76_02722 [bacterium ADurb.Bin429]